MLLEPALSVSKQQQLHVHGQQLEHHVLHEALHQVQVQLQQHQQLKVLQLLRQLQ
jgi:hypothetical protein